jgi:hypothetical protein
MGIAAQSARNEPRLRCEVGALAHVEDDGRIRQAEAAEDCGG